MSYKERYEQCLNDESGCQLVLGQAKQVISYVDAITDYHTISFRGDDSLILWRM